MKSWTSGPAGRSGEVLVSVTDFTADHLRDMPGIHLAGTRLARLWPGLEGAVGHWLWAEPLRRRCGSVSLWQNGKALRAFVALPEHREIMRTYRNRGTLRSTTWTTRDPELPEVWSQALAFLQGDHGRQPYAG
ncbi:hypothetical protein [Kibdelosporangium persicum]|uniref:hypothetical protein n=1 Tax=Kibdelosporangium persicum TaxID=2698649 RepID=UPI0015647042|nr:hypothetical protein [Kibdelosporangium persicum]